MAGDDKEKEVHEDPPTEASATAEPPEDRADGQAQAAGGDDRGEEARGEEARGEEARGEGEGDEARVEEKRDEEARSEGKRGKKARRPVPRERVERILERARAAAKADQERKAGRWLALIPATMAVVLMLLMMPRSTVPEAIPLPRADQRVLAQIAREEDARARDAEEERLPTSVLAVGSALRAIHKAQAEGETEAELADARRTLDAALRDLPPGPEIEEHLLSLRALQTRRFLDAVARWEATGEESADLRDLGGDFIGHIKEAGWATDRRVLLSEAQRRIMFKIVWNALTGVDSRPAFAVRLDEHRELYAFYLQHPHPPDNRRVLFEQQRREATTPEACARANAEERRQTETWRADKIRKLAALDPEYPAMYALGVAYYRAGRYDLSVEAFSSFVDKHPDGPYALRAKNHLKAALAAHGP